MNEYVTDWLDMKRGYLEWYIHTYPQCITTKDKKEELAQFLQAISILKGEVIASGVVEKKQTWVQGRVGEALDREYITIGGDEIQWHNLEGQSISIHKGEV